MHPLDSTQSTFTTQELARLAAYRAAVDAGFYTDWDGSSDSLDTATVAALLPPEGEAYPFTDEERQRLEATRTAVVAGRYADDEPPRVTQTEAQTATSDDPAR